eukprot:1158602-Pelagomonas_calceolata.AAC.10
MDWKRGETSPGRHSAFFVQGYWDVLLLVGRTFHTLRSYPVTPAGRCWAKPCVATSDIGFGVLST